MIRTSLIVTLIAAAFASGCQCSRPPTMVSLKKEGDTCTTDDACETGLCEAAPGFATVCTRKCGDGCNADEVCTQLTTGRFSCQKDKGGLCSPCQVDTDCPYPADKCLSVNGSGVCGRDCAFSQSCPTSYRCLNGLGMDGQAKSQQCTAISGSCDCTSSSAGQTKSCTVTNGFGTCTGMQTCDGAMGFGACSARTPAAEICNGIDDDCDMQVDEGLSMATCGVGACQRTVNTCVAGNPVQCVAGDAGVESCNGIDDDCDGTVDNGTNLQSDVNNCGRCGTRCMLDNASAACRMGACEVDMCTMPFLNCDGRPANGCEVNSSNDPMNCGSCGRTCMVAGANSTCVAGMCQSTCATGFVDLDNNMANGCEYACTFTSAVDQPDVNFVDANCDGLDGEVGNGIFVATTGDDFNDGTMSQPVRTIAKAVQLATTNNKRDIYVGSGSFGGGLNLTDVTSKIVAGGYTVGMTRWTRTSAGATIITGNSPALTLNRSHATIVQNFSITGASASGTVPDGGLNGNSAYGAMVINSYDAGLELLVITAGDGAPGANAPPTSPGDPGGPGGPGQNGCTNDSFLTCGSCAVPSPGTAGASSCGRTGGTGGTPGVETTDFFGDTPAGAFGRPGGPGQLTTMGGPAGTTTSRNNTSGTPAAPDGANGSNGGPGSAGQALGVLTASGYQPSVSGDGTAGTHAHGGGGGGGGTGGCNSKIGPFCSCWTRGSAGGGGGGGGCGGPGGRAGGSGGASIALFLWNSRVRGFNNQLISGQAGRGGTGAAGGSGGGGGMGGASQYDAQAQGSAGTGGRGGQGGTGGSGGPGAGGVGGATFGIASGGNSAVNTSAFNVTLGSAGQGGAPGTGGQAGPMGAANTIQVF